MKVSVIIKALNEEQRIAAAVQSALDAVAELGGEVILADSVSSDNTIAIASEFPITIVQLKNPQEKRCGIGPQLGYQVAKGEYIYILDGDMELDPRFLATAVALFEQEPQLGGVAGIVEETSEASYQFRGRTRRQSGGEAGDAGHLEMGGLYRRAAIEQVGYFSNRNLHAFEELDLGLRLKNAGWKLKRLAHKSVVHHGYDEGNWPLLARRWRSHYADGSGELIRAAIGKPHFMSVLMSQKHLIVGLAIWLALLIGIAGLIGGIGIGKWLLGGAGVVIALLILLRTLRTRSIRDAVFAQVLWQVNSIALLRGLFAKATDPTAQIEYIRIKTPEP